MAKNSTEFKAVILAGGSGERFWPLSTPEQPKQFLRVFGGESLIRQSVTRLLGLVRFEDVYVVTSKDLVNATRRELPEIPFIFAGTGPLEGEIAGIPNVKNVGFQRGQALENLIRQARFSLCPSEVYENCPFSVMESQLYGTPVLGADIGGIPELIEPGRTGELFESGNAAKLTEKIRQLWEDRALTDGYSKNCAHVRFDDVRSYTEKLLKLYRGEKLC